MLSMMLILREDWNDERASRFSSINNGHGNSIPFNDVLVLHANKSIDGTVAYNACPDEYMPLFD